MKAANEDGTVGSKLKYPLTVRPTPLYNVVAASTEDSIYSLKEVHCSLCRNREDTVSQILLRDC